MIEPMIKYSFLLFHKEHESFLGNLKKLGIIDVTVNDWQPNDSEKLRLADISRVKAAYDKTQRYAAEYKDEISEKKEQGVTAPEDGWKCVELMERAVAQQEKLRARETKIEKEIEELAPWGDFSVEQVSELVESGISITFMYCGLKEFNDQWNTDYNIEEIYRDTSKIYFAVITISSDDNVDLPNVQVFKVPDYSLSFKRHELKEVVSEIDQAEEDIIISTMGADHILALQKELSDGLEFSKIQNTNQIVADGSLVLVEGWSPINKIKEVDDYFESMGVIMVKEKPLIKDNPPILLKNNKFSSLLEVVTKLYSMPDYKYVDLTPFFAPFFIFFVGFCFADIGYGIITFLLGVIVRMKSKDSALRSIMGLVMWCSVAAVVMGIFTGNIFGVELVKLPAFDGVKGIFLNQSQLIAFAISVGVLQIIYAMFIKAIVNIKRFGFKYGISTIAWASTILIVIAALILPKLGIESFTTSSIVFKILVTISIASTILFTNPEKGILSNMGLGTWELYNSITGFLGDTLSYIRLFALGLSGSVIANAFNELAMGMSPDIPVVGTIITVVIMLLGHTINIFMAAISSFVHPLRLTFVEFYKNSGFESGGKEYTPFK